MNKNIGNIDDIDDIIQGKSIINNKKSIINNKTSRVNDIQNILNFFSRSCGESYDKLPNEKKSIIIDETLEYICKLVENKSTNIQEKSRNNDIPILEEDYSVKTGDPGRGGGKRRKKYSKKKKKSKRKRSKRR
tara:strand:- start:219 stop:617 length:399 start_codon:yes stop_codon:yes gene_type:complete